MIIRDEAEDAYEYLSAPVQPTHVPSGREPTMRLTLLHTGDKVAHTTISLGGLDVEGISVELEQCIMRAGTAERLSREPVGPVCMCRDRDD